MCGIIGYTGSQKAAPLLIEGLQQLEYRGYDSAGVSIYEKGTYLRVRSVGYVDSLKQKLGEANSDGTIGIAHTRWATHGAPSEKNAHPHTDSHGNFHVVHNGIIENHRALRDLLGDVAYESDTDTEVIAHLMALYYNDTHSVRESFARVCEVINGSYALALLSSFEPDVIYFARKSSPLLLAVSEDGAFVCSDVGPLIGVAQKVFYLKDGERGSIDRKGIVRTVTGDVLMHQYEPAPTRDAVSGRGVYAHFMEKEMNEAPQVIQSALNGRLDVGQITPNFAELTSLSGAWDSCEHVRIVACGTSYHAALYGKYIIESVARIPVTVEIASEFRYRTYLPLAREIVVLVSQSGETADTLAALQCAREHGIPTIGIVNVEHSTIARTVDACILLRAGHEVSVASTKACISQSVVLALLALTRAHTPAVADELRAALCALSVHATSILSSTSNYDQVLSIVRDATTVFCLGRGGGYAVALEAALKLKEVAYVHAEGYPGGELKHGSLALIDTHVPTIAFVPEDSLLRDKMLSNIAEVRARGGIVISVSSETNGDVSIKTPPVATCVAPILHTMVAHMIAYRVGRMRGTSIDKPRNLAKAVTVE